MGVKVVHYLAFIPSHHFGMSEQGFVEHASSHEPRSRTLARLRDNQGWRISIHTLTLGKSHTAERLPLSIPIRFWPAIGRHFVPVASRLEVIRRRLLKFAGSAGFVREMVARPPELLVFRGNIDAVMSRVLAAWRKRRGLPYIYEHHGGWLPIVKAYRQFLVGADRIFVLTEECRRILLSGYDVSPERVVVMPNGVAADFFRPDARGESGYPRLALVGMLTWKKGLDVALDALAAVRESWPGARLTVAGLPLGRSDSWFSRTMNSLMERGLSEAVDYRGWLSSTELVRLYSGADILLFPSRSPEEGGDHEGEPRVVLEAMACGTPVVAVSRAGVQADIITAADCGALASSSADFPQTVVDYLRAHERVVSDRRRAREYVMSRHSIESVATAYERECIAVLQRH